MSKYKRYRKVEYTMSDKPLVLKAIQEVFDERFEKEMKELDNKTKAEISLYSDLTSDYQSEDFQSEIIGGGYPVQICVNTAEKYAYCIPLALTDNEYTAEYNTAYRDCVNYGKVSCYGYEDYNRLASELADKLDYRNRLEQGEGDELDACFAYNDDYEDEDTRGR